MREFARVVYGMALFAFFAGLVALTTWIVVVVVEAGGASTLPGLFFGGALFLMGLSGLIEVAADKREADRR